MTKMCKQSIVIKETPLGRDMLDVLAEKQLRHAGFCELDISKSIITLKAYLVKKLAPKGGEYPSQLRFGSCATGRMCSRVFPNRQDLGVGAGRTVDGIHRP